MNINLLMFQFFNIFFSNTPLRCKKCKSVECREDIQLYYNQTDSLQSVKEPPQDQMKELVLKFNCNKCGASNKYSGMRG